MSRKIYGFCDAGCKYEVPGKDDVVNKDELLGYSKVTSRMIKISNGYIQPNTDIWNNGDVVLLDFSQSEIHDKANIHMMGMSGTIELTLNIGSEAFELTGGSKFNPIFTKTIPFDHLIYSFSHTNSSSRKCHISHLEMQNGEYNDIYKIEFDLVYRAYTLVVENVSVDIFHSATEYSPTNVVEKSDGILSSDINVEMSDYVPSIKIKSLNFFYV